VLLPLMSFSRTRKKDMRRKVERCNEVVHIPCYTSGDPSSCVSTQELEIEIRRIHTSKSQLERQRLERCQPSLHRADPRSLELVERGETPQRPWSKSCTDILQSEGVCVPAVDCFRKEHRWMEVVGNALNFEGLDISRHVVSVTLCDSASSRLQTVGPRWPECLHRCSRWGWFSSFVPTLGWLTFPVGPRLSLNFLRGPVATTRAFVDQAPAGQL